MIPLLKATQAPTRAMKPSKCAVVLIDMQTAPPHLTYFHGSVSKGIERVCSLLELAKRFKIPIVLVEYAKVITPSIASIWPENAKMIQKHNSSAFSSLEFETFLKQEGIETLVIAGYNRRLCVLSTVKDALTRGYGVFTSDSVLFGDSLLEELSHFGDVLRSLFFFRKRTKYYSSLSNLENAIESSLGDVFEA